LLAIALALTVPGHGAAVGLLALVSNDSVAPFRPEEAGD
jgi:hypothetical protein